MVSVMLYPYIFSIDLSIDLFSLCGACLTVFDETICNIFLDEVVILLLNVMAVMSVCGGAQLDIPCMVFQRMCVLYL